MIDERANNDSITVASQLLINVEEILYFIVSVVVVAVTKIIIF